MKLSLTGSSLAAFALTSTLKYLVSLGGGDAQDHEISHCILLAGQAISGLGIFYGQLRRKDVKLGIFKK